MKTFGCSRLRKSAISWLSGGKLRLSLLLSHWKPQGEIFFIPLGSHFPPQWRSWLGMNGESFFLSGTMGQEQMQAPSGVPRAAWLGHLKLCGLMNVKSASYISVILLGFGG